MTLSKDSLEIKDKLLNDLVSANEELKRKINDTIITRDSCLKEMQVLRRKNEILMEEVGALEEALVGRSDVEGQMIEALRSMEGLCDEDLSAIENII
jgi:hypothetical protein